MQERIDTLRALIARYRERLHAGVSVPEGQTLLRLIIELEAELERLLQALSG